MIQVPNVPPMMVQPQPAQQPSYNAVKIDIINPSVGTGNSCQAQYAQPTMPYYSYPQQQVYEYPQVAQQPYYPPMSTMPVYPNSVNPSYQVPVQPQAPVQNANPAVAQIPVQQPVNNATSCPPGQVPICVPADQAENIKNQVAQQQNIQQQNINIPPAPSSAQPTAEVPEPVVSQPVSNAQQPEVVSSETISPQVDLNSFIAKLANPDFDVQASGMEEIANLVKASPEKATELVDTMVFDSLNNIMNFDSAHLEGPTDEQLAAREKLITGKQVTPEEEKLANTITPKEQAERNKSYALYTTAILQKLYGDEVERLSNQVYPLTELPNATGVVNALKDNPNPMVRESAIEALSYLQRPEYKKDLTTVFTVAQNDVDPRVSQTAKAALEKLNQI